jgi:hypothetical protein
MIAELRGAFVLLAAFVFFTLIVAMLALGAMMRPARWSERPRMVG